MNKMNPDQTMTTEPRVGDTNAEPEIRSRAWLAGAVLLAGLLLSSSCSNIMPKEISRPDPSNRDTVDEGLPDDTVLFTNTDDTVDAGVTDNELYQGTGEFINEEAAASPNRAMTPDGEIVLNFEGESIQSVVHTILGEVLQETFVIGPGVSGQVTFATSKPVTREQLMPILELLLRWNGATLVWSEGRYHVLPVSEAVRGHLVPRLGGAENALGYEVRAVPLQFISPTEMQKILEPYARDGAILNVDVMRSMIFVAGTREELSNYLQVIEIFDVDWLAGMSVGVYPLQTVDVESISMELTAIFGMEAESPLAGLFRFVPMERLGAIMVITPREEYLDKAKLWIERLDRGAAGGGSQLFVYRVKNLEAGVLANYLSVLFGGESTDTSRDRPNNLSPGLEPVTSGSLSEFNSNRGNANRAGMGGGGSQRGGGAATAEIEHAQGIIRITSVMETNSLLIQATQPQYSSIEAAIARIDIEPLQVLVEAQVLDVELNETLKYGVDWYLTNNASLLPDGVGPDSGRIIDSVATDSTGMFSVLSNTFNGGAGFVQMTITALDEVTDIRAIAAPSLVVQNNAQASITVGTQVPVQSSSINTGGGVGNVVSSAQYVSTGVTLTVTPRINPGGLVYMDISQEVSRPGARDPSISTSPNPPISNKSVTSQVAVQSGETVFLGGLITELSDQGTSGVPFLNRIPGIGALFGTKSKANSRFETIVMITPTVIESAADLRAITDDLKDEFIEVPPIKISTIQD
jgi:general secretion pathway protein D